MNKAEELLKQLGIPACDEGLFQIIADLDASDIVFAFEGALEKLGFSDILIEVAIDDESTGILVRFEDAERDDVLILFTFDEFGDPIASVVSEEDQQITIDLSALDPPAIEVGDEVYLDLLDLSWMNKTTLGLLLKAGKVGPNPEPAKEQATDGDNESLNDLQDAETNTGIADKLLNTKRHEDGHPVLGLNKVRLPVVRIKDKMTSKEKKIINKAKSIGML